jgi:hypothetical protein
VQHCRTCNAGNRSKYQKQHFPRAKGAASSRVPESFPVIANRCNWRINAVPFCRHFGIDIDTQLKFIRPDLDGDALLLKLNETVSVGGRKRYGPRLVLIDYLGFDVGLSARLAAYFVYESSRRVYSVRA